MQPDDMFLKVEFTAYFEVNGLKIEKKEYANDSDLNGIYLNGKMIMPDLNYYLVVKKDDSFELKDLPNSMKLEMNRSTYHEEFVTRAQIWKEDPHAERIDELLENN